MSRRQIIWIIIGVVVCAGVAAIVYVNAGGLTTFGSAEIASSTNSVPQAEAEESVSRKKIGEERNIRSWETGDTTVTLYKQDLEVTYQGQVETQYEHILKAKRAGMPEIELARYYYKDVTEVFISPLGTYVTADVSGYESRFADTYEVGTGEVVISGYRKIPYWTSDEKKVALIQSDASIDGTPAAFYYSDTGNPRNTVLLREFDAVDFSLRNSVQTGNLLTMTMTDYTLGDGIERTYLLDLQTGTLASK